MSEPKPEQLRNQRIAARGPRMKLTLVILALVACVTAFSVPTQKVKIADKNFLEKQKFLFEIVHRIDEPLMFEEWIKMGQKLITDKAQYEVSALRTSLSS